MYIYNFYGVYLGVLYIYIILNLCFLNGYILYLYDCKFCFLVGVNLSFTKYFFNVSKHIDIILRLNKFIFFLKKDTENSE